MARREKTREDERGGACVPAGSSSLCHGAGGWENEGETGEVERNQTEKDPEAAVVEQEGKPRKRN